MELERWLCDEEYLLVLQKTQIQLPESMVGHSPSPIHSSSRGSNLVTQPQQVNLKYI